MNKVFKSSINRPKKPARLKSRLAVTLEFTPSVHLFIDLNSGAAPQRISLGISREQFLELSKQIQNLISQLSDSGLSGESLRVKHQHVLKEIKKYFSAVFGQKICDIGEKRKIRRLTALSYLNEQIQTLTQKATPIDFVFVCDEQVYIPWELLSVDTPGCAGAILGDFAWISRTRGREALKRSNEPWYSSFFPRADFECEVIECKKSIPVSLFACGQLKGVADEAAIIDGLLQVTVTKCRPQLTTQSILNDFSDCIKHRSSGIAHFACHCEVGVGGNVNQIRPDFTLHFGNANAVFSQVTNYDLHNAVGKMATGASLPLVVFNVCRGGSYDPFYRSPSATFLNWGAPAVISQPGAVNDESMPVIVEEFYKSILEVHLRKGPIWLSEVLYCVRKSLKTRNALIKGQGAVSEAIQRLLVDCYHAYFAKGDVEIRIT